MIEVKKILIDPGHGGKDPGAIHGGLVEKDLTMFLAQEIQKRLNNYIHTELFQLENVTSFEDLKSVVDYANNNRFDYFVSIHINAGGGEGFETFVHPNTDDINRQIQNKIHWIIMQFLNQYNIKDRGTKEANFYVLRETNMRSILIENLFIDNPYENMLLKNKDFLIRLANQIAYAIIRTFDLKIRNIYKVELNNLLENEARDLFKKLKEEGYSPKIYQELVK